VVHFRGKDVAVRGLYARFAAFVRRCGPVTVHAQKTRIVFQARARFVGVMPRRRWFDVTLWLKRRVESSRFSRIESLAGSDFIHHLRIERPSDLDRELAALLREAHAVGRQAGRAPGRAAV
jgi:hypothetical protein